MEFKTAQSRRAAFAHMPKIHGFPLRGTGGRSKRNRATVTAGSVAGVLAGGLAYSAYGEGGLTPLLRRSGFITRERPGLAPWRTAGFQSHWEPQSLGEKSLMYVPGLGSLLSERVRGPTGELGERMMHGTPLMARVRTALLSGRRVYGLENGQQTVRLAGGLKPTAANVIDQMSLWKLMGGLRQNDPSQRGRLYDALNDYARTVTKYFTAQGIRKARRKIERRVLDWGARGFATVDRGISHVDRALARRALRVARRVGLQHV